MRHNLSDNLSVKTQKWEIISKLHTIEGYKYIN